MKRYSVLIVSISCIILYTIFNSGQGNLPIEKIDISSGISNDLFISNRGKEYSIAASVYTFNEKDQVSSVILEGIGSSLPDTRSNRQTTSGKKFELGLQKVFIFSEVFAKNSINVSTDILLANQGMNDSAFVVVCKGKAIDMLKFKVYDVPTSSDHISGMVESAPQQNFMSDNYKIMDIYVRVNSEGRGLVLPYLEILNNKITLTGMAVFKKDKMVANIPMSQAIFMNILRENKVKGILTLQKDLSQYISNYGEMKRKVHCEKINGKYKFNIDLEFKGNIVSNTMSMYNDLMGNPQTMEKYTHKLEEQTKKNCEEFIYKMQNEYKVDCLELGRDAAATFGRNPETDWDDVVCNSEIIVNVKVKVNNFGRGQFLYEKE